MFNVEICNISVSSGKNKKNILNNCFFNLHPGKKYILFGRNGSGKTTLSLALTNLLDENIFSVEGKVFFEGRDILQCSGDEMRNIIRKKIKYVFQDPVNCFDPLKKFKYYFSLSSFPKEKVEKELDFFLLPAFDELALKYPHEVSVGMAQRIALALSFAAEPNLIIMDEPNSALDLASSNLLAARCDEFSEAGSSILIITQDFAFARRIGGETAKIDSQSLVPFIPTETFFNNYMEKECR